MRTMLLIAAVRKFLRDTRYYENGTKQIKTSTFQCMCFVNLSVIRHHLLCIL